MRISVKILHTVASAGLTGGLLAYLVLLVGAQTSSPGAYADLRGLIALVSNWLILPSLAVALISGLLSMVVHKPYMDKGWVWLKAALGILMFKGILTVVGAKADYAADVSARIADGSAPADALSNMLTLEWYTLLTMIALTFANYVLGVWRPRLNRRKSVVPHRRPVEVQAAAPAPANMERIRRAA